MLLAHIEAQCSSTLNFINVVALVFNFVVHIAGAAAAIAWVKIKLFPTKCKCVGRCSCK